MNKYLPPHPFDNTAHPYSKTAYSTSKPYLYTPKYKTPAKESLLKDFSDPNAVNSIADLVSKHLFSKGADEEYGVADALSSAYKIAKYGKDLFTKGPSGIVSEAIAKGDPLVKDFFKMQKENVLDPIVKGVKRGDWGEGFGAAALFKLNEIGEIADFSTGSNVLKALAFDRKGMDSVKQAMGIGTARKQFDAINYMNTGTAAGNFIWAMLAEMALDPTTALTFGGKALVKAGSKGVSTGVVKAVKGMLPELTNEVVEQIAETAAKQITRGMDIDDALRAGYNTLKDKEGLFDFYKKIPDMEKEFKEVYKAAYKKEKGFNLGLDTIKGLNSFVDDVDAYGSLPLKLMWYSTGVPIVYKGIKLLKGTSAASQAVMNKAIVSTLKSVPDASLKDYVEYIRPQLQNDMTKYSGKLTLEDEEYIDLVATYVLTARNESAFLDTVRDEMSKAIDLIKGTVRADSAPTVTPINKKTMTPLEIFETLFETEFKVSYYTYIDEASKIQAPVVKTHIDNLKDHWEIATAITEKLKAEALVKDFDTVTDTLSNLTEVIEIVTDQARSKRNVILLAKDLGEAQKILQEAAPTISKTSVLKKAVPKLDRQIADFLEMLDIEEDVLKGYMHKAEYQEFIPEQIEYLSELHVRLSNMYKYKTKILLEYADKLQLEELKKHALKIEAAQFKVNQLQKSFDDIVLNDYTKPVAKYFEHVQEVSVYVDNIIQKYSTDTDVLSPDALSALQQVKQLFEQLQTLNITPERLGIHTNEVLEELNSTVLEKMDELIRIGMYHPSDVRTAYSRQGLVKLEDFLDTTSSKIINSKDIDMIATSAKSWQKLVEQVLESKLEIRSFDFSDAALAKDDALKAQLSSYKEFLGKTFSKIVNDKTNKGMRDKLKQLQKRDLNTAILETDGETSILVRNFVDFLKSADAFKDPLEWLKHRENLENVLVRGDRYREKVAPAASSEARFDHGEQKWAAWEEGSPEYEELKEFAEYKLKLIPINKFGSHGTSLKDQLIDKFGDIDDSILEDVLKKVTKSATRVEDYVEDVFEQIAGDLKSYTGVDLYAWTDKANEAASLLAEHSGAAEAEAIYSLQLSKHFIAQGIINSPPIVDIVRTLSDPGSELASAVDSINTILRNSDDPVSQSGEHAINIFSASVRRFKLVSQLFAKIKDTPNLKLFANTIIDTLLTHASKPLDFAAYNRTAYFKSVFEDIKKQAVSKEQKELSNLEKVVEQLTVPERASFDAFVLAKGLDNVQAHEARYDVTVVKWLLENKKDWFDQATLDLYDQGKLIIYDIETTDLSSARGEIYQIAYYDASGNLKSFTNKNFDVRVIDSSIYNKIAGQDPAALVAHMSDPTVHTLVSDSESALLDSFLEDVLEDRLIKELPTLFGWNVQDFDSKFIKDRLRTLKDQTSRKGLVADYTELVQHDGYLQKLKNIDNIPTLSSDGEFQLMQFLNNYLDARSLDYPLYKIPYEESFLYDTINRETIEALDVFLKNGVKQIDVMQVGDAATAQAVELLSEKISAIRLAYMDVLTNYKQTNKLNLKGMYIVKNSKGELCDFAGERINLGGNSLHVMQLLHSGNFADPYMHGVKKIFNRPAVEAFLGLSSGTKLNFTDSTSAYKFAHKAEKVRQLIHNVKFPLRYMDESVKALHIAKQWGLDKLDKLEIHNVEFLKFLNPDGFGQSGLNSYATLQAFSDLLKTRGESFREEFFEELRKAKVSEEYIALLKDTTAIYGFDISKPSEWTKRFWLRNMDPESDRFRDLFREPLDDIEGGLYENVALIKDMKATLSTVLERADLQNVETAMLITFIDSAVSAWIPLEEYIKKISGDIASTLSHRLMQHTDLAAITELVYLKSLSPEELANNLFLYRQSYFTFNASAGSVGIYRTLTEEVLRKFKDNAAEYAKYGVHIEGTHNRVWFALEDSADRLKNWNTLVPELTEDELADTPTQHLKNQKILARGRSLKQAQEEFLKANPVYKEDFKLDLPEGFMPNALDEEGIVENALNQMRDLLHKATKGASEGSNGEVYSKGTHLKIMRESAPVRIKELVGDVDQLLFPDLNFNRSIIGTINSRQEILEFSSGNLIKNYFNAAYNVAQIIETKSKILNLFYKDDTLYLEGPLFKQFSSEELFEAMFKDGENAYVLTGMVEDVVRIADSRNESGVVKQFAVHSAAQLDKVREISKAKGLRLHIMPIQQYLYAANAVNDFKVTNPMIKFFNEYIVGTSKTAWLTATGFITRNFIDTGIKNAILAGPGEQKNMLRHTLETFKIHKRYNEIMRMVTEYNDGVIVNKSNHFSKRILDRLYTTNPDLEKILSKDMFNTVHNFVIQGPSAGLSKEQKKVINATIEEKRKKSGADKEIYEKVINNIVTNKVMSINSEIEQVYRLSAYTWELMHGVNTTESMATVLKYHFDYTPKSRAQYYADYAIPFAAFVQSNTFFWMKQLDTPSYFGRLFINYNQARWTTDDRKEMQYNMALQYHMLTGNLYFDNFAIKLNPSVMDAIQTMTNPMEFLSKFAFFIKIPVQALMDIKYEKDPEIQKKLLLTIPILGTLYQRTIYNYYKTVKNSDNTFETMLSILVPSIFSSFARYEYVKKIYAKKKYMRRAKRYSPKKPKHKKIYFKKSYAPRSYTVRYGKGGRILGNPRRAIDLTHSKNAIKKGTTGLKAKMIPTTYYEYKKKLRGNWKYIKEN